MTEQYKTISPNEVLRLGRTAKEALGVFYITSGVPPDVAHEASSAMFGPPLADLVWSYIEFRVDPNLKELKTEFNELVNNKGFDPAATAILLTDGSFRFAHWQGENKPFFSGNYRPTLQEAEKRGKAMGRKYRELLKEGKEPVVAAKAIVESRKRTKILRKPTAA